MKLELAIKQSKFKSTHHKAVLNLIYTANWIVNKQQSLFKSYGITGQQFNVLRILKGQYPKSISGKEIKARMLDMNSDISRLLDRLLLKGLVKKNLCPSDKRASEILITDKGINLLNELSLKQKELDHILALSDTEAAQLSDLLDKSRS